LFRDAGKGRLVELILFNRESKGVAS
jgi:hypothetical protein